MANVGSLQLALIEPVPATVPLLPSPASKPRGRPMGSKNRPKPPVVVTRESESAMRPVVLELDAGCDVATAVAAFARRRRVGVSLLCGRGAVAAVTLRIPISTTTATTVTLHGRFEILSLSGTVLPSAAAAEGATVPPTFSVSLAGAGGQVIGGTLAGEMTAADGLVVVAATFGNAEVCRLSHDEAADDEEPERRRVHEGRHPQQQDQTVVGASAVDVGMLGCGGGVGLGGGVSGEHQQQQLPEMDLWAQVPVSRGPAHPAIYY